jgi:hypothetical protein
MLARKCDGCGKLYEIDDKNSNGFSMICMNLPTKITKRTFKCKNLCPECMESLINRFDKKGVV